MNAENEVIEENKDGRKNKIKIGVRWRRIFRRLTPPALVKDNNSAGGSHGAAKIRIERESYKFAIVVVLCTSRYTAKPESRGSRSEKNERESGRFAGAVTTVMRGTRKSLEVK